MQTENNDLEHIQRDPPSMPTVAAILAGGLGMRLRSVVADRPKPLAEVEGRPFLVYQLEQLAAAGIGHVVLCTGYQGEQVRQTLGGQFGAMRLSYSQEAAPLGTAGALRQACHFFDAPRVLALNGDSYCAADLRAFAAAHLRAGHAASVLLASVPDVSRYGRVQFDTTSRLTGFDEKGAATGPGWVNAGVYLFETSLLAEIPTGRAVSLEKEMFPRWLARGLYAHAVEAPFLDIGTPESYAQAGSFLNATRAGGVSQPAD